MFAAIDAMVLSLLDDRVCSKTVESALLGADTDIWVLSIKDEITALYDVQAWQLAVLGE